MHFSTVAAIVAAAAVASANPVNTGKTFQVKQVENPQFKGKSGPIAYAKGFAKYGVKAPAHVQAAAAAASSGTLDAAAASSSGSVAANPESDDTEYLCPVQIGTPAQTLNLDFDTGSADLWVFSSETPRSEESGQTTYKISSSSTAKKQTGESWQIEYGDGSSCSGDVYTDVVTVGGVTVTSQAVESAETVSPEFVSDTDNDGLLGLAFSTINTVSPNQAKTFFANAQSSLASPLFTANLKKGKAGNYNFGYIDSSEYTGSITYTTVDESNGFWEITASGYGIGSGSFTSSSIDAIVDTGTTLLYLDSKIVQAYYAKVSGSKNSILLGGYTFPCSATLPDFTFGVGSYRGVIPGSYLNYSPATGSTCFGGLQSNTGIGFSIFGDILLKSQFVVFDAGNKRVGFAAKPT